MEYSEEMDDETGVGTFYLHVKQSAFSDGTTDHLDSSSVPSFPSPPSLDDETGVGTFYLHVKQKKDENDKVKIEGGYAGE